MNKIFIPLVFLGLFSCKSDNPKSKTDQTVTNKNEPTLVQNLEDTIIKKDCKCPDLYFSDSKVDPILTFKFPNNELIICGYVGNITDMGVKTGQLLDDGSFYMQGYNIFNCRNLTEPIFTRGEVDICKIDTTNTSIKISVIENLPLKSGWQFFYTPITSYEVIEVSKIVKINGPNLIVDLSALSNADFDKMIHSLSWDKENPEYKLNASTDSLELKLYGAFITAVKFHPKYKVLFENLGPFDGYIAEIYTMLLDHYKTLK